MPPFDIQLFYTYTNFLLSEVSNFTQRKDSNSFSSLQYLFFFLQNHLNYARYGRMKGDSYKLFQSVEYSDGAIDRIKRLLHCLEV